MMRVPRSAALVLAGVSFLPPSAAAQSEQLRDSWQRVPDLFAAAGVRAGANIADVGAGDGFLTVRLAPAVGPTGKVYAVDVDAKVADTLRQRLATAGITNVAVVVGTQDDPRLPVAALDGALILNAYHEMARGVAVLKHLYDALKPGGQLVLCEPTPRSPNQSRQAQMDDHVLDPALILDDLRAAGFQVLDRQDLFATNLGGNHFGFVVAKRP
ncbi:MAG TPA: methyltransferase domain-containing protein [Vicinamibacterales bacterium]|nr:methyltransferase domain-containing protein [Vicinamibacterales bacterium]